jgi:hypothetical protein
MIIDNLLHVMPVCNIEPNTLAMLGCFSTPLADEDNKGLSFDLLEPPAGQHLPFVDAISMLTILYQHAGIDADNAKLRAQLMMDSIRPSLPPFHSVLLYTGISIEDVPECVAAIVIVEHLRHEAVVPVDTLNFITKSIDALAEIRIFRGPDNWREPIRLSQLPDLPSPKAMMEFFVGLPSDICETLNPDSSDTNTMMEPFYKWREQIRPAVEQLEKQIGQQLFYFADLDYELDDDVCHRYLALHCLCSLLPKIKFVQFLVDITGAKDVEELKNYLLSKESYTHPFEMNGAFVGLEAGPFLNFRYLSPGASRNVGVVFSTIKARDAAKDILLQQIGANVSILSTHELVYEDWYKPATRFCASLSIHYCFDKPITFLAGLDELHVISDESSSGKGFNLNISKDVEKLLWLDHRNGCSYFFHYPDNSILGNPEDSLERSDIVSLVEADDVMRREFTMAQALIRLNCDYGSSGLWTKCGGMISYELIDIPFALVRRIYTWQQEFNNALIPMLPGHSDETWWDQHSNEEMAIALELQLALGDHISVVIWRNETWTPISILTEVKVG